MICSIMCFCGRGVGIGLNIYYVRGWFRLGKWLCLRYFGLMEVVCDECCRLYGFFVLVLLSQGV